MPSSDSRNRNRWRLLGKWGERFLWVALLVWLGHGFAPQLVAWVGIGKPIGPAPAFEVETHDGGVIGGSEVDGQVLVLSFWATWCLPCRIEMPVLQKLHDKHADRGLLVLGLATDGDRELAVESFLEELEITFPIATASTAIRAAFGGVDRLPTTILIDRRGQIRHRVEGLMAPPALQAAVRRLLDEP